MYSISSYYIAHVAAVFITTWIYPVFAGAVGYYWFAFEDRSFSDYLYYEACLIVSCIAGNFFGFMFGCLFSDELLAIALMQVFN